MCVFKAKYLLLFVLCVFVTLAGCGQKGDLYLPARPQKERQEHH
ncbi:MAG TPA: lipoprotein [Gammaproteobacteria bacterium]|jgi:predicted small lipoprotein YifL|nr:lipoprotein [Gammaproteobacteria bacterium]HKH21353.1 lipoprotein [Gammaproteobacteria bacterium]